MPYVFSFYSDVGIPMSEIMSVERSNNESSAKNNKMILLELQNLFFQYRGSTSPALQNINLQIFEGEDIAIVGPNGCGKTTLIKHFNGLLRPTEGNVFFRGNLVDKRTNLVEHVGFVFQNPDEQVFFPIVEEDIAFGPKNQKLSDSEVASRVTEALRILKIEELRTRSFFSLSFGEKKKVALAGVLAMRPSLLVLDEPTIGLDPWSHHNFLSLLHELRKHTTLIIATHDFTLLKEFTTLVFLWDGEIRSILPNSEEFEQLVLSTINNE